MLKRLAVFGFLLILASFSFAAGGTPVSGDAAAPAGATSYSGGSGGDTPGDPAHTMDDAVNIYIHVILRQPDGPPPPSLQILSVSDSPGSEEVNLKASASPSLLGGKFFRCYREGNWPMKYRDDLDTLANYLGRTNTIYFTDEFIDPWWSAFGSKGVSDPDVNYFYVYTTVDSNEATSELTGSPYPSNCVAEFDQDVINPPVAGTRNILAYVTDHRYGDGSTPAGIEICEDLPGTQSFMKWNFTTQQWITHATYYDGWGWYEDLDASLDLGQVFQVDLESSASNMLFSTYEPGIIDDDLHHPVGYSSAGLDHPARYWMMLPINETYNLKKYGTYSGTPGDPVMYSHIGMAIQGSSGDDLACTAVSIWNVNTQQLITKATYYRDYYLWYDETTDEALPGHVICAIVEREFHWPLY